jgi:hypothetical protein
VLTTWLLCSKDCRLSLSFEMQIQLQSSPKLPYFTAALISHSQRREHIRLQIPFKDLRWLDRPFPLLRDLTFGDIHKLVLMEGTIMVFVTHRNKALKALTLKTNTADTSPNIIFGPKKCRL